MYCIGTNCQCSNCGKKWVITYKELVKQRGIINKASQEQALGVLGATAGLLSNNAISRINNTNIANSAYIRANQIMATSNADYVQDKYCPECKSPCINREQFYYLADDITYDYIRPATKYEFDAEVETLNRENQRRQEEAKAKANWSFLNILVR